MKNYIKVLILGLGSAFLLLMFGCEKEIIDNSNLQENPVEINSPPFGYEINSTTINPCYAGIFDSIQVQNGMLKFLDMDHLEEVYNCLEFLYEENQLEFEISFSDLTSLEMDSMETVVGFNHWEPYEDFETLLNFSSRREYIENLIITFLDQTSPDWDNDPDDFDDLDETMRTLVNVDGDLIIGSNTVNFIIIGGDKSIYDGVSSERSEGCKRWDRLITRPLVTSNTRIKHKTKFNGYFPRNSVKGKVVHHRLRSNGKWRRSRANLYISTTGSVSRTVSNCSSPWQMGSWNGPRNRRSLKTVRGNWGQDGAYASGEVGSTAIVGIGSNAFQHHQVIEW